jgi:hypothetical protein
MSRLSGSEVADNPVFPGSLHVANEKLCGPVRCLIAHEPSDVEKYCALDAIWHRAPFSVGTKQCTPGCLPRGEFAPVLVNNPEMEVTFKCSQATPLELVRAVGFQTRLPIGVVLGRDLDLLSMTTHAYYLENADARSALSKAIEGTGYSMKDENGVVVLIAGDLAPSQRDLLVHQYSNFGTGWPSDKMICLGMTLTGWMREAARPESGYAISCSTSTNEEQFKLNIAPVATTEEIANQIVSQCSKGMWIFKVSAYPPTGESTEEIDILPYQHYSNRAITNH